MNMRSTLAILYICIYRNVRVYVIPLRIFNIYIFFLKSSSSSCPCVYFTLHENKCFYAFFCCILSMWLYLCMREMNQKEQKKVLKWNIKSSCDLNGSLFAHKITPTHKRYIHSIHKSFRSFYAGCDLYSYYIHSH